MTSFVQQSFHRRRMSSAQTAIFTSAFVRRGSASSPKRDKHGTLKTNSNLNYSEREWTQVNNFRLRHAYGELGQIGFVKPGALHGYRCLPEFVEYWDERHGFFRNVQLRWMPLKGDSRVTIAIERPGASADGGVYRDRIELQDIRRISRCRTSR